MTERWSSNDLKAGRVPPHDIGRGIIVPPNLRVNTETLPEHQARMRRENRRPLNREEALALFPADEVTAYFGPEAA